MSVSGTGIGALAGMAGVEIMRRKTPYLRRRNFISSGNIISAGVGAIGGALIGSMIEMAATEGYNSDVKYDYETRLNRQSNKGTMKALYYRVRRVLPFSGLGGGGRGPAVPFPNTEGANEVIF